MVLGAHARGLLYVCVSVCPSVTALAASASAANDTQGFVLGFSWICMCGFSKKQKLWREKANMQISERFRALSGPTKGSNNLKDDCLIECCVRD